MGSHDHVLPLSYGGSNDLGNLVTACWVCQFGRGEWLIEDVRVSDPREREPLRDEWDGLLRILK
jgi:5-methylcytosine-specific restriction endonuclease McrA